MTTYSKLSRPMRSLIAAAATLVCMVTIQSVAATAAHAGAVGCSGYGPGLTYKGAMMSKGTYCVQIAGKGNYVDYVYGQAQVNNAIFGTTCNWNMTAEFFDSNGRWYQTYNGPRYNSCFSAGGASYRFTLRRTMRTGFMCSTLKSNGSRLTSVCHNIHP